ncbi:tail fiber domain-containing protein [Ekhidna sp.]|uniref:tail fiber domain-containing protein n=1 Tax=Ekhidna sp. TaxID=2608089 RepID=UPI003CCB77C9
MKKIASIVLIFYAACGLAQVPETMHFQGFLADPGTGNAIADGNYSLTFTIFDAATAGSSLWTETHTTVSVADGYFSAILGSEGTPLTIAFDAQYYLEVEVGGETLSPRYTLASSAYALNARRLMSTDDNVFIGVDAGLNTTGIKNTFVGARAGQAHTTGIHNVFVGTDAGLNATAGNSNTFIGTGTGLNQVDAANNVFIGIDAGNRNVSGSSNVYLGQQAGNFSTGSSNVFIGANAGVFDLGLETGETGNNKLYIENSVNSSPLIYGEFDNDIVGINGKLGLGTTSPTAELDIVGTDVGGGIQGRSQNLDATGWSSYTLRNDLGNAYSISMGGSAATVAPGKFYIFNGYTSSSSLAIDESGNVGIGTESPSTLLHINQTNSSIELGDINPEGLGTTTGTLIHKSDNSSFPKLNLRRTTGTLASRTNLAVGDALGHLQFTGYTESSSNYRVSALIAGERAFGSDSHAGRLRFATRADGSGFVTTRMLIDDNGDIAIGVATPSYRLHVEKDNPGGFVSGFYNLDDAGSAGGILIGLQTANPSTSEDYIRFVNGSGSEMGVISGDGSSGVSFSSTSDRRLKKDIKDLDNSLEIIERIKARTFIYKTASDIERIGFIAQELQEVYPQAVSGDPSGDVNTEPMMVDYSKLTPLLTGGIQELLKRVEALEKENASLKSNNQKLSSELSDLKSSLSRIEKALGITSENKVDNLDSED